MEVIKCITSLLTHPQGEFKFNRVDLIYRWMNMIYKRSAKLLHRFKKSTVSVFRFLIEFLKPMSQHLTLAFPKIYSSEKVN